MMDNAQLNEECHDISLRLDKIIWLATAIVDYALPDDLKDLLEEEPYEVLSELFNIPAEMMESNDGDADFIAETILGYRRLGYLVQAATPVHEYKTADCCSGSWGYHYTKWIYAETLEDAVQAAKDWATKQDKKALDAFLAKGGAA